MPSTHIYGTQIKSSRFIFGTGSLFNAGNAAARRAVLNAAVENGFTHFDTAPLYGFGMAERDLAPVLASHRSLTITTKVGLYAPGGHDANAALIALRKGAGKLVRQLSRPVADASVNRARRSLDASLRRLRREHVELLLLHEPNAGLIDADEWLRWLEEEVRAGRVGAFGVAGPASCIVPFITAMSPLLTVIQTEDSLDRGEAQFVKKAGQAPQITYGYVSAAKARGDVRPVDTLLETALMQHDGPIIVSTTRLERIELYRDVAARVSRDS